MFVCCVATTIAGKDVETQNKSPKIVNNYCFYFFLKGELVITPQCPPKLALHSGLFLRKFLR
jgi:hypothetical protein